MGGGALSESHNSRRGGLIPPPARIHPTAGQGVAVIGERAFVVCRRTLLSAPDCQRVSIEFIHVIERFARAAVVARVDVRARLLPESLEMTDDLHALVCVPAVDEFDAFGATRRTLRQFIAACTDLYGVIRDVMIPNPDQP